MQGTARAGGREDLGVTGSGTGLEGVGGRGEPWGSKAETRPTALPFLLGPALPETLGYCPSQHSCGQIFTRNGE